MTSIRNLSIVLFTFLILGGDLVAQELEIQVEDVATLPVPHNLTYPAETVVDGKIYYFGGLANPSGPVVGYDEMWQLDLASGVITELPFKLPYELTMAPHVAAAHLDGNFYLSPGFATGDVGGWGSHNQVVEVDLAGEITAQTSVFPSSILWASAAVAAEGKIYFFGGWNSSPQSWIFELDPQAGSFVQVASMLGASNDVVPVVGADGWIYYWGRLLPDIQRFHPATHQVESTGLTMVTGGGGAHRAYVFWHFPAVGRIYFAKPGNNTQSSSALYLFNYDANTLESTSVLVPEDLVNQRATLDPNDPTTIYAYRTDTDLNDLLKVTRVRLAVPCEEEGFDDGDLDGWTLAGIGNANQEAVEVVDDGDEPRLALTADGATAYYGADNAGFLYRELTGDFRFETTVDVAAMVAGKPWAKTGLMVRASLDHWDIRLLAMLVPEQERLQFPARDAYGAPGNVKVAFEVEGAPAVVRLAVERSGQTLGVQYSLDGGGTWVTPSTGLGGSVEIAALPETLLVGLAMVSNNISVTSTALFDDVVICR